MEVKIKLNNKDYIGSLGLGFLGEVIDILDSSYDEILDRYAKNPVKYVPLFMYHSIKYYGELVGEDIDFEKRDLIDWVEQDGGLTNKELIKFSQAFIESITKDVPQEEELVEDGEKKS